MNRTLCLSVFCCFLFACGDKTPQETIADHSEPTFVAFADVATAMEEGADLATTRRLLLDAYPRVSNQQTNSIEVQASEEYLLLANQLADKADGDTLAALPLYKAAEVYQALGDFKGAALVFERIYNDYPSFSKAGEALFMLGFTYDENLRDTARARRTYEKFLAEYPTNTFADDTQMLLSNLGKSDEEMLQMLQEQVLPTNGATEHQEQ